MSTMPAAFALIGRSFTSDDGDQLYRALTAARAEQIERRRRAEEVKPLLRRWRGSGEAVTLPMKLPA